jgi:hypothetical protein
MADHTITVERTVRAVTVSRPGPQGAPGAISESTPVNSITMICPDDGSQHVVQIRLDQGIYSLKPSQ